jgi:hypothetical protein
MSYDLVRLQQFLDHRVQNLSGLCFVLENRIGPQYAYRKLAGPLEEDRCRALVGSAAQRDEVGELVFQIALYWLDTMSGKPSILLQHDFHLDLTAYLQELEEFGGDPGKMQAVQQLIERIDPDHSQAQRQTTSPPPLRGSGHFPEIFLSYCRRDGDIMRRVHDSLIGAGLSVWVDQTGIPVGTPSWSVAIEEGIDHARCVVVLLSPDAKASKWVRAELDYAVARSRLVFPILVRGDVSDAVPLDYIRAQWIDVRDLSAYEREIQRLITEIKRYLGVS